MISLSKFGSRSLFIMCIKYIHNISELKDLLNNNLHNFSHVAFIGKLFNLSKMAVKFYEVVF